MASTPPLNVEDVSMPNYHRPRVVSKTPLLFGLVGCLLPLVATAAEVVVYKDPSCGCCVKWVEHLKRSGFEVTVHDDPAMDQIKKREGIPADLGSCHTAVIEGYKIEGHVPAAAISRLLKERPPVAGLSVPGMPMGSPGMEGPTSNAYDVVSFDAKGKQQVFEHH
jgi:hypothetical protein